MSKILVVDDNEDFLQNMKSYLKRIGYEVAVTTTCVEALTILEAFMPALIVLDVNVGEEDGRETCKAIKAKASYQHIPVILISASHEYGTSYKDYGADLFVDKPFSMATLTNTLQSYL